MRARAVRGKREERKRERETKAEACEWAPLLLQGRGKGLTGDWQWLGDRKSTLSSLVRIDVAGL